MQIDTLVKQYKNQVGKEVEVTFALGLPITYTEGGAVIQEYPDGRMEKRERILEPTAFLSRMQGCSSCGIGEKYHLIQGMLDVATQGSEYEANTIKKRLLILCGPNGSGKSTLYKVLKTIPEYAGYPFINADAIKAEENRTDQDAFEQANARRDRLVDEGVSFITETVFSHPSKLEFIAKARAWGYEVIVFFVTTEDPAVNIERVRNRVAKGGHDVPTDRIIGRYKRVMELMPQILGAADKGYVINNSHNRNPELVFEK